MALGKLDAPAPSTSCLTPIQASGNGSKASGNGNKASGSRSKASGSGIQMNVFRELSLFKGLDANPNDFFSPTPQSRQTRSRRRRDKRRRVRRRADPNTGSAFQEANVAIGRKRFRPGRRAVGAGMRRRGHYAETVRAGLPRNYGDGWTAPRTASTAPRWSLSPTHLKGSRRLRKSIRNIAAVARAGRSKPAPTYSSPPNAHITSQAAAMPHLDWRL
jgi:hypothetical protein